jgi:hypothetical protein
VLVLWVPLHRRWWTQAPFSWVFPFREEKGIELDAIGREVWAEYDGRRTLEQIIDGFAARHRVRFHEARVSVVQFSSSLFERRLITVRAPEDAVSEGKQNPRRRKKRKGSAP